MLRVKQSSEVWNANVVKAISQLRPAVFVNDVENGRCVAKWLKENRTDSEGWTDGTAENIVAAIKACDAAGLIKWEVAPKRRPKQDVQHSGPGGRRNHSQAQPKDLSRGNDVSARVDSAKEAVQQRQTEATLSQARRVYETFSAGRNHSKTQDGRKVLKGQYDQLVASGTPADEVLHSMSIAADKQYAKGASGERL